MKNDIVPRRRLIDPSEIYFRKEKMTGKQKIGVVMIILVGIGLLALAGHYDYQFLTN